MRTVIHTLVASAVLTALTFAPAASQPARPMSGKQAPGQASSMQPQELSQVDIVQRLGESLPLNTTVWDETGTQRKLGDFFGERPVVFAFVYYECPMLCTLVLNGLTTTLRAVKFDPGSEYDVVALSIDPGEGAELARGKKQAYLERFNRPETADGWHFLTADVDAIAAITDAAGFSFTYDPQTDEYAHASAILVVTPSGKLARYFYGIEYPPRDVRLGLIEAADEKIGNLVDSVLLYCFNYDPASGTYSAAILNIVRLGAIFTLAALLSFMVWSLRRDRRPVGQASMGAS